MENKEDIRAQILADMAKKDAEDDAAATGTPVNDDNIQGGASSTDSSSALPEGEEDKTTTESNDRKSEEGSQSHDKLDATDGGAAQDNSKPVDKKAQRGRARLDDIRKQAEADKAEAKREREAAERAREETRRAIQEAQSRAPKFNNPDNLGSFSAEEFDRAADHYESQAEKASSSGDLEAFHEHTANARHLRRAAGVTRNKERAAAEEKSRKEFATQYKAGIDKILAQEPDLANEETDIAKNMIQLLNDYPILQMHPQGFEYAYDILQMRRSSGKADELSKENKRLKEENERFLKMTALEGGSPAPLIKGADNFDKLPRDKQREVLRRQAEKADGY